jgi:LacI family transcriptional regulator
VTEYLLALGHTDIAFVPGPEGLHTSRQRLEGFRAAMGTRGLQPRLLTPGGFDHEAGHRAALRAMAAGALPDAVLGANDEVAIGVLRGLRAAGVAVPDRVSVAGIDDTRPARFLELTTVRVPLYELGALGARMLFGADDGPAPGERVSEVLAHRLMARATTAPRRAP